jgi:hypothetical protein
VGVQYVREDDERRAFLGEVSRRSRGSLVGSGEWGRFGRWRLTGFHATMLDYHREDSPKYTHTPNSPSNSTPLQPLLPK